MASCPWGRRWRSCRPVLSRAYAACTRIRQKKRTPQPAAEAMAAVRLLEADEIKPGGSTWAQFVLESPVAAIKGDRYIIRSPMETLGGGGIVDARAKRLRRLPPEDIE